LDKESKTVRVTAYNSLQPLFPETDEQLAELRKEMFVVKNPNLVALSKHPIYPDRADYMPSGFFRNIGDPPYSQDLGTHGDYVTVFKKTLAAKFYGKPYEAVFQEPTPGPFLELLFFDEAGQHYMIGPKTAEKLARDFLDHRNQAEQLGGPFFQRFALVQGACEFAAKSGAVRFVAP
jgi:hypothetical protein